jgi:hypothetical protein
VRSMALPPALPFGRGRRLSEGALVEARIRGRVLGIPLLKIDAVVALVPANPSSVAPSASRARSVEPTMSSGNRARRLEAPGSALAEAVQSIDEAAELLAEERRNGSDKGPFRS